MNCIDCHSRNKITNISTFPIIPILENRLLDFNSERSPRYNNVKSTTNVNRGDNYKHMPTVNFSQAICIFDKMF